MPKKRITAQMVERIGAPLTGQVEYFDKNMPGFALRVSYSGTKSWIVMTRVRGKLVRITLAEWPTMTLADAHKAARVAKDQAKAGSDPREIRRHHQAEKEDADKLTFGRMADEFLARYAVPKLRPRTVDEYRRILKGSRTEAWRDRPIGTIGRRDVMTLFDCLEAEGKHATAKLALAYLRKFFGWCLERDAVRDVPTYRIRLNGVVRSRERVLSPDELRRVWRVADKIGGTGGALVKILMLTGQRRYETSVMRWRNLSGFDNGGPLWSIPGEVTKNHRPQTVPLAPEAVAVIGSLPIISATSNEDDPKCDLVFTTTGKTPWSGFSKLKTQFDQQIAGDGGEPMAPWVFHDLRRSLVTGLNEHGLAQPHVIEAVVNHVSGLRGGVAGVYNRAVYMEERRRALEAWAKLITGSAAESRNVVSLRAGIGAA